MRMKILVLWVFSTFSLHAVESGPVTYPELVREKDFENECTTKATEDEKSNCEKYFKTLKETVALRIARCGDNESCSQKEKENQLNINETFNAMEVQYNRLQRDQATLATKEKGKCEAYRNQMKINIKNEIAPDSRASQDGSVGTSLFKQCVQLSGNNMRYLHKKGHEVKWEKLIAASEECIEASPQCGGDKDGTKRDACEKIKITASHCDGAAFLLNEFGRDWNSTEQLRPHDEPKGGNPEIRCYSQGIATLDYEGCAKFVQNGDLMDAAQMAIHTGQQLYYQDKAMTAQMEAASSTDTATAGLKALHTGVKGQEEIMTQRTALDTGKFSALATYYSQLPSLSELEEKCINYDKNQPRDLLPGGCTGAVKRSSEFGFLLNEQAKERMKSKLVAVGVNVTSDAVMASLMAKRAGDINNSIAKIEAFKPIDPLAPLADNLQSTYCQQNPGDAKCLTGGLEKTFDAMGDNVISFGDGGTGTSYVNNNPLLDTTKNTNNAINPSSNNGNGVGSIISAAPQDGGLADTVAGATVTKGTPPSPGGGGGGSGGGGVGGGGSGAPPSAQQTGGVSSAIQGKAPTYGGGAGTLSMMGGHGINKSQTKTADDGNPFGKLFNKDVNKSGSIDFGRNPASQKVGTKGADLFEIISKRYSSVNNDKRLLEYEMIK